MTFTAPKKKIQCKILKLCRPLSDAIVSATGSKREWHSGQVLFSHPWLSQRIQRSYSQRDQPPPRLTANVGIRPRAQLLGSHPMSPPHAGTGDVVRISLTNILLRPSVDTAGLQTMISACPMRWEKHRMARTWGDLSTLGNHHYPH